MKIREKTDWNYSYYPVTFENEKALLKVQKALIEAKILPRRYFYPSLNTLNYVERKEMPVSENVANRILCLPLQHQLMEKDCNKVINIINGVL